MLANILRCLLVPAGLVLASNAAWSPAQTPSQTVQIPPRVDVPHDQPTPLPAERPATYRIGDELAIARAAEPGLQFAPRPDRGQTGTGFVQQASYNAPAAGSTGQGATSMPGLLAGNAPLLPPSQALAAARNRMANQPSGIVMPQDTSRNPSTPSSLVPPPRTDVGAAPDIRSAPLRSPVADSMTQRGQGAAAAQAAPRSMPSPTGGTAASRQVVAGPRQSLAAGPATGPSNTQPQTGQTAVALGVSSGRLPAGAYASTGGTPAPGTPAPGTPITPTLGNNGNETPALKMSIPSVEIQAFGPGVVGIHKSVQYRVTCKNRDTIDASRVSVSVNLPPWVRVQNVNVSNGRREKSEDTNSGKVVWMIDMLPSGQTQTMTLDVVATRAETFDLGIDWAMQPISANSRVAVTEPRLEMNIAGPNEVLFGETATYNVTVRNPGTGVAEGVVVMLPEALGGEKATIGDIPAGQERTFQVELLARAAGQLDLTTSAAASGNLQANSTRNILVRRPQLEVVVTGPPVKYAGSTGEFEVTIRNSGDAIARDVLAAIALPPGVQYLNGIDGAEAVENGLKWNIGSLDIGDLRRYRVQCQLNVDGQVTLEVAARGSGEIAAVSRTTTTVETVDDIVLSVEDPKGPLPVNQKVDYVIRIRNRGSRSSGQLNLTFMFSDGIEPASATGLSNTLEPGKVTFSPINNVEPGQEIALTVVAIAGQPGTHKFRAQLVGSPSDAFEVCEGTTRFYGEGTNRTTEAAVPPANSIR